ncbi:hypothetical protein FIBSPDRAFT_927491 [Athelia psychrophila]|uniref:G-patch domain-containing protein n=1 Tax=Athelia psychrophila TaxID=1759441 RepID=A0A166RWN9_9AGAM|nr:hypothetical protein FIBSPDRAFT_927491 [Fibularhizoctonia sp. CBS 109695]
MSSRLKRKLGDIGVDTHSGKVNESFCLIGTPLPPLEKSKDNGEFVPVWKQDVRDEQGRRRLHGAFTGGFSAGYFNSVGSKEGWTPQTFVSSRSDRAKAKSARPEDFMDDEDLAELREGRELIDTNEEMDILGGTESEKRRKGGVEEPEKDAITKALESSLLPTPSDSSGARILKKMGWRVGQGVGPRLTWRQRRKQDIALSTGSHADSELPPSDDEEASKHTYAPRDTPMLIVDRKEDSHGIGYTPGMGLHESLGGKGGKAALKGPNLSAGFGLGAVNDADEDDLDIYDGGSAQPRRHMAYDASEKDDEDQITIGSASRHAKDTSRSVAPTLTQTFSDGRTLIAGFVLADKPVAEDLWFPLPDIPKGWSPNPKRMWDADKNKENVQQSSALSASGPVPHRQWKAGVSADDRGKVLGETPLPSAPRSVFEFMSQKDRERIQNAASSATSPSSIPQPPPPPPGAARIEVPRTEPHTAQAALRGFQAFAGDRAKQARYTAYLTACSAPSPDAGWVPLGLLPGQSADELNKEMGDFAKAALIFKPMSGAMAGRFTSAAVVEAAPKPMEGLHMPSVESANARIIEEAQRKEREEKQEKEEETPKMHAVRMGMWGRLTRDTKPWAPAKLLCKRFGVKDPNPAPSTEPAAAGAPAAGAAPEGIPEALMLTGTESFRAVSNAGLSGGPAGATRSKDPLANVGLGEDDEQGRETLTYERPAMDIFKAIFASDDEDSDDEEERGMDVDMPAPVVVEAKTPTSTSTSTGTVPAPAPPQAGPSTAINNFKLTEEGKVDIGAFKPTFIPRDGSSKTKEKKEKKDKKKKKAERTIVSFDVDEDGEESLSLAVPKAKSKSDKPKDKDKSKSMSSKGQEKEKDRPAKKPRGEEADEDMWVEKPPPVVVTHAMDVDSPAPPSTDRGRKRAEDFW